MTDDKIKAVAEKVGYEPYLDLIGVAAACKTWMVENATDIDMLDFADFLREIVANRLDTRLYTVEAFIYYASEDYIEAFYNAFCEGEGHD